MVTLHSGLKPRSEHDYQSSLRSHSDIFKVARVICIFCMVYVHIYLFDDAQYFQGDFSKGLRVLLVDVLGRSSVPLLSVISGLLMVGYFSHRPYSQALRRRALTLLLPLLCWVTVHAVLRLMADLDYRPALTTILPIFQEGQFLHLDFLRDVFVLAALTPVLIWVLQRGGWLGLVVLIAAGTFDWLQPLVLRGQILVFYSLGLLVGCYRLDWLSLRRLEGSVYLMAGALAVAVLAMKLHGAGPLVHLPHQLVDLGLVRTIGCLLFYFAAMRLATWPAWLAQVKGYLEPAVFLLFLSHTVTVRAVSTVLALIPQAGNPVVYYVVWFGLPIACYVVALMLWRLLGNAPAWAQMLVAGKARTRVVAKGAGAKPMPLDAAAVQAEIQHR